METSFTKFLNRLSSSLLYFVVFLIPIFFLPLTLEPLEFNKYFLFYLSIFLSLLAWVGRGMLRKTFEIKRTPLDIPLVILWAIVLITSVISQDRYLSFFGDFTLLNLNFLNITALLIFYFLLVQQVQTSNSVIRFLDTFLFSGLISGIYFILRSLNLFSFFPSWLPQFNLVNASNSLFGVFLIILFILSISNLAIRKTNPGRDILVFLTALVSLVGIIMIGFKVVWIILAVALIFLIVFLVSHTEEARTFWTSAIFAIFVASILFTFLGVPSFLTAKLPLEVSLGQGVSWTILKNELTDSARNFIFGTGLSTFPYNFSQFRPSSLNNNFAWNVRFRQPYSSAMEWAMSTGFFGALAFLLAILMELGLIISTWLRQVVINKRKKLNFATEVGLADSPLIFWGLTAAWLTLLVSFFTFTFGAAHWLLFWLFLGLMARSGAGLAKNELPESVISLKTTPQYSLVTSFLFILIFTGILVGGIFLGRFFVAEVVYAKALKMPTAGQEGLARLAKLQEAIRYNPSRVPFYLNEAEAFLLKAQEAANQTKDVNQVAQLAALAVNAAKASSDKAPRNVATWEFLATMYANARAVAPGANNWVITSLEKATALEPTNPTFFLGLGNAKLIERRYSEAKEHFEQAITLKPDLLQSYLFLAATHEAEDNLNKAVETIERGLPYGNNDSVFLFQTGRYYFNRHKENDWSLAELAFKRAISLNPNYSDALFALALLYERTNNKISALTLYQRVLELNPDNSGVKAKVNKLSGVESAPSPEEKTLPQAPEKKK